MVLLLPCRKICVKEAALDLAARRCGGGARGDGGTEVDADIDIDDGGTKVVPISIQSRSTPSDLMNVLLRIYWTMGYLPCLGIYRYN